MTRHTRRRVRFDCTLEWTGADVAAFRDAFKRLGKSTEPWGWLEYEIKVAQQTLAAIEAGKPGSEDPDLHKPHAGAGWYSQEIVQRGQWLKAALERGDYEFACRCGYEIGQLATAIRLKNAADYLVGAGRSHLETRETVNASNRKATDAERKSIVQTILSERRRGVDDACAEASTLYPGKGRASTFRTSYFKKLIES